MSKVKLSRWCSYGYCGYRTGIARNGACASLIEAASTFRAARRVSFSQRVKMGVGVTENPSLRIMDWLLTLYLLMLKPIPGFKMREIYKVCCLAMEKLTGMWRVGDPGAKLWQTCNLAVRNYDNMGWNLDELSQKVLINSGWWISSYVCVTLCRTVVSSMIKCISNISIY